ncbi:hypothetical protein SmJEL517_g02932 [Synchytrium microbalum]|uniref:Fatty acyl-CoA reductase n=1 Tax=Synchytrium microbalum TaxID=1806994 RepID=A0A507C9W6_9FUNG|nr:uncharacterized protein SmJEL517_g02932 [Synchytrium microbalum]TPX34295.1 hypothetical protein SmJEL517_g02932 [Synchytrium microbalum]
MSQKKSVVGSFFAHKNVLITGATGFVGKALLAKILRSTDVATVYVLVRTKKNTEPKERIDKLLSSHVFLDIDAETRTKVECVAGDIMESDLGLSPQGRALLCKEVHVIINCAAIVAWNRTLDQYIRMHVLGMQFLVELARDCKHLQSLVHVSTAFTNCERRDIVEKIYPTNNNYKEVLHMLDTMSVQELEAKKTELLGDKYNAYCWSKALGEELLEAERGNIPCSVVRPSIVTSSYREQPGWVEGLQGITGGIVGGGTGLLRSIWGDGSIIADIIPVDIVVNTTLAAAYRTHRMSPNKYEVADETAHPTPAQSEVDLEQAATRVSEDQHSLASRASLQPSTSSDTVVDDMTPMIIYHCTSGKIHPITWGEFLCTNMLEARKHGGVKYYPEIRRPNFTIHRSKAINNVHEFFGHKLFGMVLDPILVMTGRKPMLKKTYAKWNEVKGELEKMMTVQGPWFVDNFLALIHEVGDDEAFFMDVSQVDWKEYSIEYARGIQKYIMPPRPVKKTAGKSSGKKSSPVSSPSAHTPQIVD